MRDCMSEGAFIGCPGCLWNTAQQHRIDLCAQEKHKHGARTFFLTYKGEPRDHCAVVLAGKHVIAWHHCLIGAFLLPCLCRLPALGLLGGNTLSLQSCIRVWLNGRSAMPSASSVRRQTRVTQALLFARDRSACQCYSKPRLHVASMMMYTTKKYPYY
jgi:hypothetical protein